MSLQKTEIKDGKYFQFGNARMEKGETICLKSEFDYIRNNGTKFVGRYILLVIAATPDDKLRYGVICGKKYSKKAVARNRARRLIKESYRLLKNGINKPVHFVFIARVAMKGKKMQDIQKEMLYLFKKAEIWQEN